MSERTIARWNAIPLERPDESAPTSLKRGRTEDEQDRDDDDDISLVSRSPSPLPQYAMDVDENHLHKYDEYLRGPAREVITVETKIKPSNKGFALLAKLGWVEGQPVGLSGDGRTEPIPFHIKSDLTGLGKTSQDVRMIETTVSQRRGLDSERQQKESEEQRKLREESVAKKTALESEISSTLRAFYCELCDKQFKNVAQYDEHTNSYAHHHKARFKDMQASVRLKPKDELDKRKEKERKREEKELRKIAAANGIKMPKPAAISSMALTPPADPDNTSTSMEIDTKHVEPKKGGWASITSEQGNTNSSSSHDGTRKSGGWATLGGSSSNILPPQRFGQPPPPSDPSYPVPADKIPRHIPTFRNAGWTSLDTGSSQPLPLPPPPPSAAPPPPPLDDHVYSNVPPLPSSVRPSHTPQGGWSPGFTSTNPNTPPPPPPSRGLTSFSPAYGHPQNSFVDVATPPPPSDPVLIQPPPPLPPSSNSKAAPASKPARSNWQQFQKGVGRKK